VPRHTWILRLSKACFRLLAMITALAITTGAAPRAQRAKGGPVETGPGSVAAARKYLEGRWGLLSFEVLPPGEPPIHVKGAGSLTYDAFGNLEVELRVDEATARLLEMAGIPSTKGVVSMSGRTVVDMQSRTLTYMLEGQPPFGARRARWRSTGRDTGKSRATSSRSRRKGRTARRSRWADGRKCRRHDSAASARYS
jgi:hypothetical protein